MTQEEVLACLDSAIARAEQRGAPEDATVWQVVVAPGERLPIRAKQIGRDGRGGMRVLAVSLKGARRWRDRLAAHIDLGELPA